MVVLAHVSDLHLDGGQRAAARAERVIAFLDELLQPVDAVLLTGDLADHGTETEYEEVRALLSNRQRFLLCPGNHDVRGPYRKVLLGEPPTDGPINQMHELPGLRVAMCDSSLPGRADGHLTDETLQWLADVLSAASTTPTLLAFHHPPLVLHRRFIDATRLPWETTVDQHAAERLAALLTEHPQVVAVVCGHAHTPAASVFAGLPLLVAPGVASTPRLDEQMPPALAFHVLDDDGRLTTHYRLTPTSAPG